MYSPKIVLVSTMPFGDSKHLELLRSLHESRIQLLCVVGVDAQAWEDAMDWMCIGSNGEQLHHVVTTAHVGESVEEVIAFAEQFPTETSVGVEVLYV